MSSVGGATECENRIGDEGVHAHACPAQWSAIARIDGWDAGRPSCHRGGRPLSVVEGVTANPVFRVERWS